MIIAVETVLYHEHPHLPFHPRNPDCRGLHGLPQLDLKITLVNLRTCVSSCLGSMVPELRVPACSVWEFGQVYGLRL